MTLTMDRDIARKIKTVFANVAPLDALQLAHALRIMGKARAGDGTAATAEAARAYLSSIFGVDVDGADFAMRAQVFRGRWARVYALWSAADTVHAEQERRPHDVITSDDATECQEYMAFNDELSMVASFSSAFNFLLANPEPRSFGGALVTHIRRISWDSTGRDCDDMLVVDALAPRLYVLADAAALLPAAPGFVAHGLPPPGAVIELEGGRRTRSPAKATKATNPKSQSKPKCKKSKSPRRSPKHSPQPKPSPKRTRASLRART
jgi:hypothetical protein